MLRYAGVHELTRNECLALVPTVSVGRVVFTDRALPAIVPVNFLLHGGRVVVRTGTSSTLAAAVRGTVVAFEVDDFDTATRTGWTVTITGRARHVVDDLELAQLRALPLAPFAGDHLDHVVVIPVELVSGRRVGLGPLVGAQRPVATS